MVPVSIHSKSMFKYLVLYLQTRVLHLPWKYWVKMLRENLGKWGGFPHRGFTEEMASAAAAAAAKSLQSCPTLCDPIDGSPPGSPVPGILPARTLEWVAISFSNAWKWSRSVVSDPQRPHGLQPIRLLHPWDFPGRSTGVGCYCLLRMASALGLKCRVRAC